MTWNGRELTSINNNTYTYSSDGLRRSKTVNYQTTTYDYSGSQLIHEKRGNKDIYYSYDESGKLVKISYNNISYYVTTNMRGDVEAIYNANGQLQARYVYDSWGKVEKVLNASNTEITDTNHIGHINPIRYRGYYYDTETSFYYLQSRYYDSEVGRFISADGQINTDMYGTNLYAYCSNNPINNSDSTGKWFGLDDVIAGVVGLVVGLASQFICDVFNSIDNGELEFSNWQTYAGAALGGAVSGVASLYLSPTIAVGIGAGASTFTTQTLENHFGLSNRTMSEIVFNSGVDAVVEMGISKFIPVNIPTITNGRNSMAAVFSSGLTKLGNQTAKNMSIKVMGKGFISELCGSLSSIGISVYRNYVDKTIHKLESGIPQIPIY